MKDKISSEYMASKFREVIRIWIGNKWMILLHVYFSGWRWLLSSVSIIFCIYFLQQFCLTGQGYLNNSVFALTLISIIFLNDNFATCFTSDVNLIEKVSQFIHRHCSASQYTSVLHSWINGLQQSKLKSKSCSSAVYWKSKSETRKRNTNLTYLD